MSALSTDDPAHETATPTLDVEQQLQGPPDPNSNNNNSNNGTPNTRKPKAPSVRRACVACHTGKTRCSEVLPCQSCLKRGLGATCAYPDPSGTPALPPDTTDHPQAHHPPHHTPGSTPNTSDGDTKKHLMYSFQLKAPLHPQQQQQQGFQSANPQQIFSVGAQPTPTSAMPVTTIVPQQTQTQQAQTQTQPSLTLPQHPQPNPHPHTHYYDYNSPSATSTSTSTTAFSASSQSTAATSTTQPQQMQTTPSTSSQLTQTTLPNSTLTQTTQNQTTSNTHTLPFRPLKRQRALTEDETAAITRNFTRGYFYVGSSAPVHIDPRLPVRLVLGEGDCVHFTVGEQVG